MSSCRHVDYVRCMHCNTTLSVSFAHGAIQVAGCTKCYRVRLNLLKWLFEQLKRL
jgi:protein-arginine kinase activator protein McsA